MVKGERLGDGDYRIKCLPTGNEDFRAADEWTEIKASWLKINGVGFAASSFELSEYDVTITVEQDTPAGSVRINY